MNIVQNILTYAQDHDIQLSVNAGRLKVNAPKEVPIDYFLVSAKQHKPELLKALSDGRWDPELAAEGYVCAWIAGISTRSAPILIIHFGNSNRLRLVNVGGSLILSAKELEVV